MTDFVKENYGVMCETVYNSRRKLIALVLN
jgi:hypothetical protein